MGIVKKEILIGVLVSVFATAAGFFIYVEFFSQLPFDETMQKIKDGKLLGKVLTLAAIPNLFVFFVYIRKKQDYRARGVLLTTIVIAFVTLLLKFF